MKNVKVERANPKPAFEPIHVEFDIESEDELFALWHRLNIGAQWFEGYFGYRERDNEQPRCVKRMSLTALWEAVDRFARRAK